MVMGISEECVRRAPRLQRVNGSAVGREAYLSTVELSRNEPSGVPVDRDVDVDVVQRRDDLGMRAAQPEGRPVGDGEQVRIPSDRRGARRVHGRVPPVVRLAQLASVEPFIWSSLAEQPPAIDAAGPGPGRPIGAQNERRIRSHGPRSTATARGAVLPVPLGDRPESRPYWSTDSGSWLTAVPIRRQVVSSSTGQSQTVLVNPPLRPGGRNNSHLWIQRIKAGHNTAWIPSPPTRWCKARGRASMQRPIRCRAWWRLRQLKQPSEIPRPASPGTLRPAGFGGRDGR
jgi:hypothetical protein